MFKPKFYKLYGIIAMICVIVTASVFFLKFDPKFAKADLSSGLVAHWRFNGDWTDETSNNNDLTNNGASLTTGIYNAADTGADLENSEQDYLAISDGSQTGLDITGDMAVSFWANTENIAIAPVVVCKWNYTTNKSYFLQLQYDNGYIKFMNSADGSTEGYGLISYKFEANKWYHIVVNYDASEGKIFAYVDGDFVGSDTSTLKTSIYNSNAPFEIGRWNSTYVSTANFDGKLDDIRIYNRELTRSEISALSINPDHDNDNNIDIDDVADQLDDIIDQVNISKEWINSVWTPESQ